MIVLQLGQCGIQIGQTLYSNIHKDLVSQKDPEYHSKSFRKWFESSKSDVWAPRSILIDTETKTTPLIDEKSPYRFRNVLLKSVSGSGNNFACGYNEHGAVFVKEAMEIIRKQLEKSDCPCNFLNLFATSGGTGSGIGTRISEALRSSYPKCNLVNSIITPFLSGEIAVQSYNTLLCLSKINSISDAIIYMENDRLQYVVQNLLNSPQVSFDDMNLVAVQQLLGLYQPMRGTSTEEIVSNLIPKPSLNLIQVKTTPFSVSRVSPPHNWKSSLTAITKQCRFDLHYKTKYKIEPSLRLRVSKMALLCRGGVNPTQVDLRSMNDSNFYAPSKENLKVYHQSERIVNCPSNITFLSNGNSICWPLKSLLDDAENLFRNSVYLHHYQKYGVEKSHFRSCFDTIRNVIEEYKKA